MEFSEGFQFLSTATSTPFGSVVATQTPYVANHTQALLSASTRLEAAYKRVWQESGIQALKDLHAQLYQMLYSSRSEVVEISPPLFTSADLQKLPGTEQLSLGTLGHFVGKTGLKYPATRVSQQVQKTVRIALAHRMDESGIQLGYALRLYCGAGPIDVELINYSVQSSPSQPLPVFPTAPFSKPFTVPARVYNAVQLETAGYSAADEEQYDLTGEVPGKPRLFVEPRQGQANFIIEVKFEYDPTDPTLPIAGHAVVTVRNVDPAAFRDAYILNLQVLETHVPGFAAPGETETRPAGDVDLHMMPTLLLTGPEYFQDRQDAIAAMGKMMRDVNERYVRVQAPGSRPRSPIERYAQRQQAVIDAVTAIERDDPREFERLAARIAPRLVRQG
jgi:hypothetical protein